MVYEEHPEWKKLLKEKKYKEATEGLMYEMGVNMMRVHNVYTDEKCDIYDEYKVAFGYYYARNKDGRLEKKMTEYLDYKYDLGRYYIWLNDFKEGDDVVGDCKYMIKKILKHRKKLIRQMKNIDEVI